VDTEQRQEQAPTIKWSPPHYSGNQLKELADLKYAIDQAAIVSISDPQGNITYVNSMATRIYGYTKEELIGKNHRILNSGVHSKELFRKLWQTILAGSIWRGEICNKAKDGSLYWLDTTIIPFRRDDGSLYQFMAIRKDITLRKRMEERLEHERRKRSTIERLSAVGEIAANIAHEIRSPIAAIQLQAELALRRNRSNELSLESALNAITKMKSTAIKLDKIVSGLLSLSRDAENDPLEQVSIKSLLDETMDFCEANLARRGISIQREEGSENILIDCRPTQISQVLLNLINNSRDAIEALEERWIRIAVKEEGGFAEISVMDSGTGLTPKIRSRVMEPFYTTKKAGKGTGLGLSVSRQILEKHGGELQLADTRNTCFVVKLPLPPRRLH
jgi:PAS domain S-box-containing protein